MNYGPNEAGKYAQKLRINLLEAHGVDIILCPPFLALKPVFDAVADSKIKVGAQNMHEADSGAYTGEISGTMLKDLGIDYVLLGHSERRHVFGETDQRINLKIKRSLQVGLKPIFCVGETLDERQSGSTNVVIKRQMEHGLDGIDADQLKSIILAYEPVWAIGTGLTATPDQAVEVHQDIRSLIRDLYGQASADEICILYGGSVKPENTEGLLRNEDIDGVLVGGASLKLDQFKGIIDATLKIV
ncbi:MAG: triose-phosphate isomerase [Candidatus Marinimicrobia bacterium CG1_02_48_14]|nr:MAG: triose-phosphate isomerase [Candidatus Marinimicrobia bacterium CG1_02_48_14]PIZ63822.1 MAG: triose-phosphate isomerase [Candidatus Marinimicrobia bacterium CG_4_10_14_0_2_um_filter_48_9]PJA54608.1 MAG: triose-phosphate isomerase [Candidatus Marinimicrobia bacterium CG_4_9_14_3_um_filter_48_9]